MPRRLGPKRGSEAEEVKEETIKKVEEKTEVKKPKRKW